MDLPERDMDMRVISRYVAVNSKICKMIKDIKNFSLVGIYYRFPLNVK